MVLNIKDPETDRLARELAAEAGESLTVATRRAIEERLSRLRARKRANDPDLGLDEFIRRGRERAVLDERSPDDIIGYDEHGLPR
ncbi:type II toxin-antitoxin system VapB family antitoxin [Nakamurella multipartita]|uniref:Rv0623 family protein transcription factor n=1 Tax=Nakamurella multipartita (strain ATCC 700099 / DSM 44233 / CIP 104796 / JCM 9543 / NBRC 105858 / Y-104) TaxID=479431 RepID=C8XHZ8_NAKMY|nr:type II toxin-antitoxin system VapB family antitoxin [Nakamurella multipartita]ACV76489.1 Rv0623 family protein transcription factor [Nakamurella multipartita DSM 44233]